LTRLFQRPTALGFLIVAALMFLWPIWRERRARRLAG
jgi:uncharacterized membrane protein YccC